MTQDEIIEMARQARIHKDDSWRFEMLHEKNALEAFAHLVADKATEEANARANASWTLMCKKMVALEREACGEAAMKAAEKAVDVAMKLEREACAKVCETLWNTPTNGMATEEEAYGDECAAAIRARGQA